MAESERDGAAVRFPPPLVYLGGLLLGALLHVLVWPLPLAIPRGPRVVAGLVLAAVGAALVGSALGLFRRIGQDPTPWTSTPEILSTGIYRFTRNPMYLGMALLQAGIGVAWGNVWVVVLVVPVVLIVQAIAIRHEEAYLERKFGAAYLDYKRAVRRWL